MIVSNRSSHSTVFRASLRVGERTFNVAQVGNGYCILRDPERLPPSTAELEVSIDGVVDRQHVYLCNAIDPTETRTAYECRIEDETSSLPTDAW